MQKALLIAEKKSLRDSIESVYLKHKDEIPYDITFLNQVGHIVELLEPKELNPIYEKWDADLLPIIPEQEGGWQYKVRSDTKDIYNQIYKEIHSGKYDIIIHAGDPDQEGELLVNLALKKMKNTLPVLRFWNNAQTEEDILAALKNMESDDLPKYKNLYHAALVRQHSDWRFGINSSRMLASKIYAGKGNRIACGRVMTVMQTLVTEREDEINNFVPKTVYGVKALFHNGMEGTLHEETKNADGILTLEPLFFDERQDAEKRINKLPETVQVIDVKKENITTYAPKLFRLATIQNEMAKYNFSSSKTLETIQSLYEKKFLSYPRTDCEVLSSNDDFLGMLNAVEQIPDFESYAKLAKGNISKIIGMKKYVNDKELQKHGHTALVPTTKAPVLSMLSEDEQLVYRIICARFIAIFLPPLKQIKTTIIVKEKNDIFKISGKFTIDRGYCDFLKQNITESPLPDVFKGDILTLTKNSVYEKTSVCPKRYTEGSLIMALDNPAKYLQNKSLKDSIEKFSIGTSSTAAGILEKLIKTDKYIKVENNYLKPTEFGSFMVHSIRRLPLCDVDTTAQWEQVLSKIKNGEMDYKQAEYYMQEEVEKLMKDIESLPTVSYGNSQTSNVIMTCPVCGKDIIETSKNFFCAGYKDGCKVSLPKTFLSAKFNEKDFRNLVDGETIEKTLKKDSKSWKQKLAFDKKEGKLIFQKEEEKETSLICPDCGKNLKKKDSQLICSCGFKIWTKIAKKQLTDSELDYILKHGKSKNKINGLHKSNGGTFSAYICLKDGKFEFSFK